MIENSRDIFWLVLAFAVLWFALFLSWAVYYLAMILKETRKIIGFFSGILEKVDEIVTIAREKLNKSASSLSLLFKAGKEVLDFVKEKQAAKRKTKKAK